VAVAANPREPKQAIVPALQAKAKAINIQASDLPGTGWKAQRSSPDESNPRCSYYNPDQSDLTENGRADSPEFTLPSNSFVSSTTGIFKTATEGRTAYSRVVRPELPRCLAEIFRKGTGQPDKVKILSAGALTVPKLAERSNGVRIVAAFAVSSQQSIRVYLDLVTLNRGKVDVAMFFVGIGTPFKDTFVHTLAAKIAARTAGAA